VQRLPQSAIWRVAFRLKPGNEKPVDLRCYLTLYGEALTETGLIFGSPREEREHETLNVYGA